MLFFIFDNLFCLVYLMILQSFYSEIMMYSKIRIIIVIPKTLNLDFGYYTRFVTLWLSSYWILLLLVCMSRNNFLFVFPYYYIILNHFENRNVRFTLLLTVDVCFYFTRAEKYLFRKKKFPRVTNIVYKTILPVLFLWLLCFEYPNMFG